MTPAERAFILAVIPEQAPLRQPPSNAIHMAYLLGWAECRQQLRTVLLQLIQGEGN
jgi:hypothetical protein